MIEKHFKLFDLVELEISTGIDHLHQIKYNPYRHEQFKIGCPLISPKSIEMPFSNCLYAEEITGTNSKIYLLKPKIILPEKFIENLHKKTLDKYT